MMAHSPFDSHGGRSAVRSERGPLTVLRRLSSFMPVFTLGVMLTLLVWGSQVLPVERRLALLVPCAVVALVVLLFELRWRSFRNRAMPGQRLYLRSVFAAVGLVMLVQIGTKLAVASGLVDAAWLTPARHAGNELLGMTFIGIGNFLPKLISPWRTAEEPFEWHRVHLFIGRLFALFGIATVTAWLTLPTRYAAFGTMVLLPLVLVAAVARKLYSVATWRGYRRA